MEEWNKSKEVDLMEQVRNTSYDEKSLFEMCKRQVLERINNERFETNYNLFFNKLLKYFGLSFSQEIMEIVSGKYDRTPLDDVVLGEKRSKLTDAIKELEKQKYFIYNDFFNRMCGNIMYMHANWLIDKNNFNKTLCNFIKAYEIFDLYDVKGELIEEIAVILEDYYDIRKDDSVEFGYRVIPKHNIEIIASTEKLTEKEPSLKQVLDFMYAGDYKNALRTLADDVLENYRDEYKEKIQKGNETLFDIDKFFNFVNNYKIRHSKKRKENGKEKSQIEPTDEQLKVYLDFGLSIYRLFSIYQDNNNEKLAKE